MPTLIVEDGTIVAGANSYATLAQIRLYASDRGVVLPDDDETVSQYAIRAMDYLASFGMRYKGNRTSLFQLLDWPRTDVYIDGVELVDMPLDILVRAQSAAVIEISKGTDLLPVDDGSDKIKSEQVGPLKVEYFGKYSHFIRIPIVDHILYSLFGNAQQLFTRRI